MKTCKQDHAAQQASLEPVYQQFKNGQLDPTRFSHTAHIYSAWRFLADQGVEETRAEYRRLLVGYTRQWGVEDKFHYTLTDAMVLLIAKHATGRAARDWSTFCSDAAPLLDSAQSVLARYYSDELLWSVQARRGPVKSDRAEIGLQDCQG